MLGLGAEEKPIHRENLSHVEPRVTTWLHSSCVGHKLNSAPLSPVTMVKTENVARGSRKFKKDFRRSEYHKPSSSTYLTQFNSDGLGLQAFCFQDARGSAKKPNVSLCGPSKFEVSKPVEHAYFRGPPLCPGSVFEVQAFSSDLTSTSSITVGVHLGNQRLKSRKHLPDTSVSLQGATAVAVKRNDTDITLVFHRLDGKVVRKTVFYLDDDAASAKEDVHPFVHGSSRSVGFRIAYIKL